MRSQYKGYALTIASAFAAGASTVFCKLGVQVADPLPFLFWLMLFASIFLGVRFIKRFSVPTPAWTREGVFFVTGHTLCVLLGFAASLTGLVFLDPAVSALLNRVETVAVVFLASILLKERLSTRHFVALFLSIVGVIVIQRAPFGAASGVSIDERSFGIILTLIGATLVACGELFAKKAAPIVSPFHFTFVRNLFMALIYGVLALALGVFEAPSSALLLSAALAAITGPVLGRILFMHALRSINISEAAILGQTQPLFAALLAFPLIGTLPYPMEWAGGVLIVAGCIVMLRSLPNE